MGKKYAGKKSAGKRKAQKANKSATHKGTNKPCQPPELIDPDALDFGRYPSCCSCGATLAANARFCSQCAKEVVQSEHTVRLDDMDKDLNLLTGASGLSGSTVTGDGFSYLYSGARATHGVGGKQCYFEICLGPVRQVRQTHAKHMHTLRVGWSSASDSLKLGTDGPTSFGYAAMTGYKVQAGSYESYGRKCSTGDVIGCYLDLEGNVASFSVNGASLGVAYNLEAQPGGKYYPHVVCILVCTPLFAHCSVLRW